MQTHTFQSLTRNLTVEAIDFRLQELLDNTAFIKGVYDINQLTFTPARLISGIIAEVAVADTFQFTNNAVFGEVIDVINNRYFAARIFHQALDGEVTITPLCRDSNGTLSLLGSKITQVGDLGFLDTEKGKYFSPILFWDVAQLSEVMLHISKIAGTSNIITVEYAKI